MCGFGIVVEAKIDDLGIHCNLNSVLASLSMPVDAFVASSVVGSNLRIGCILRVIARPKVLDSIVQRIGVLVVNLVAPFTMMEYPNDFVSPKRDGIKAYLPTSRISLCQASGLSVSISSVPCGITTVADEVRPRTFNPEKFAIFVSKALTNTVNRWTILLGHG
jgi:hypothetical protein